MRTRSPTPGTSSHRRRAAIGLACVLVLAAAAPAEAVTKHPRSLPTAVVDDPRRLTVALMGDSFAEGAYLSDPASQGLGPRLRAGLASAGLDAGGRGFVPAHPATLSATSAPLPAWPVRFTGPWTASTGLAGGAQSVLESASRGRGARATLEHRGDVVASLFSAKPGRSRVTLRAGAQAVHVGPRSVTPGLQMAIVNVAQTSHVRFEVHRGPVRLMGFFERRRVGPVPQVEVSMLVRGGARGADRIGPLDAAGIDALSPDLTLLAFGTNDGLAAAVGDDRALRRMIVGLRSLARRARRHGRCVVLLPPRTPAIAAVADAVDDRLRAAAAAEGCRVSDVLRPVLEEPEARWLDGVHPSALGVERMAQALLPLITSGAAGSLR